MKVLFLHSGENVPSARFRALPFARRLRQAGYRGRLASSFPHKYDYIPQIGFRPSQLLKKLVRGCHLLEQFVRRFDVVIIDRELFDADSHAWEDRFRRAARTLLLDVDDGVFLRYPDKYEHLARIADGVLAGNDEIADYTRPFNQHITLMPTCIELDDYPVRSFTGEQQPPVIGWMGTTGNLPFLEVCAPALRNLAREHTFELRLIAGESAPLESIDLAGVDVRFIPWRGATEVAELSRFDIGLMPLPAGQPWMKYKCGLKLLQYMAIGIPGVASPIGVNARIIQQGANGYVAATTDEWEASLGQLITDTSLRRKLGQAARQTVEEEYSVEVHFPRFVSALEEAIERTRR